MDGQKASWSESDRQRLKDKVIASRGRFRPWHQSLLEARPDTLRRVMDFVVASEQGPIEPALRHLIWTAVDAVVTHLYPAGITIHAGVATKHGATKEQVFEALELACLCTLRTFDVGIPAARTLYPDLAMEAQPQPEQEALLARWTATLGEPPEWFRVVARVDIEYARTLLELVFAPNGSSLPPKWRMLICLSVAACPAIADPVWTERLMAAAKREGARVDEVLTCLKLASGIGIHALAVGAPAAMEELPTS